jgi:hypothetical protein
MLEKVFDTLQGIIYNDLPKNSASKAVVYDRPIDHWFIGERQIKPGNISITFSGSSSPLKDVTFGFQEFEHSINIEIDAGGDNIDLSERIIQEATRLVLGSVRRHRRMWVLDVCPICTKFALSPQHYILDHNNILASYKASAISDFGTLWNQTHTNAAPSLPDSGLATEAFYRMYEDVRSGIAVTNLSDTAKRNILKMQRDYLEPIRMLYDVTPSSNEFSDNATGNQLYKTGKISITAKELIRLSDYGPDNVPTTAFKW